MPGDPARADGRIRVLFIGGLGRSGSTVLEGLIGTLPGFVSIGEVRHLWERCLGRNDLCECGAPFLECPFWRSVGLEAFGGWQRVDARAAVAAARAVDRHRQLPRVIGRSSAGWPPLQTYAGMLERLFGAVQAVSGAAVVVDASKDPPHGFVLAKAGSVDLRVIHLVRDSRGVAHSWSKRIERPDAQSGEAMARLSVGECGLMWMDANLVMEVLRRIERRGVRLRYEDVVADPDGTLRKVGALAGVTRPAEIARAGAAASHAIGGNPVRFRGGGSTLRLDDQWRWAMSARDRRLVTGLTAPLLRRYGYPIRYAQRCS